MKAQRLPLVLTVPLVAVGAAFSATFLGGSTIDLPNTFQSGTPARASEVNENFAAIVSGVDTLANDIDTELGVMALDIDALETRTETLESQVAAIGSPANFITVSASGGNFTSVAAALASINDASETNRYVVYVAPGVYDETETCTVSAFVTLRGAGAAASIVRSSRTANSSTGASATVLLLDDGAVADLRVENNGASAISTAIFGAALARETRISNVVAVADGSGGTGHFAIKVDDSDLTIVDSVLFATGASTVNAAFASTDSGGAFAQPLLRSCDLEGDGTVSGFGMQLSRTAAHVDDCRVEGDFRSISAAISGITTVRNSRIQTLGLNPVYEQTGSSTILSGSVFFVGGTPTGLASQFKYAWCIKPNFDPVVNGFGSSIQ